MAPLKGSPADRMGLRLGVGQPIGADRAEHVELERIVERFRLVRCARRDMQDLPFTDDDLLAADEKAQRPLQDVGHLLALVRMHWNHRAALQINLRDHLALTGDDLLGDHLRDLVERDLIPAVQLGCHRGLEVTEGTDSQEERRTGDERSLSTTKITKTTKNCGRSNGPPKDRKSTRLNSSHSQISYAVFCLKKKKKKKKHTK